MVVALDITQRVCSWNESAAGGCYLEGESKALAAASATIQG